MLENVDFNQNVHELKCLARIDRFSDYSWSGLDKFYITFILHIE